MLNVICNFCWHTQCTVYVIKLFWFHLHNFISDIQLFFLIFYKSFIKRFNISVFKFKVHLFCATVYFFSFLNLKWFYAEHVVHRLKILQILVFIQKASVLMKKALKMFIIKKIWYLLFAHFFGYYKVGFIRIKINVELLIVMGLL